MGVGVTEPFLRRHRQQDAGCQSFSAPDGLSMEILLPPPQPGYLSSPLEVRRKGPLELSRADSDSRRGKAPPRKGGRQAGSSPGSPVAKRVGGKHGRGS